MQTILVLSLTLLTGLFMSRLTKIWNLPAVTAYLIAGIIIGPYCLGQLGVLGLGYVSSEDVAAYSLISDVALGFIAFSMGDEFRLEELKKTGKKVTVIAVIQAVTATLFVDVALLGLHFLLGEEVLPMSCVLVLGAIATATAPAATIMVIKQYKADGPVTRTLLPVVALDDMVGLVVFSVSYGIAQALENGTVSVYTMVLNPVIEVIASLTLGTLIGIVYSFSEQFFLSRSKRMSISVGFVFLAVALSMLKITVGPVTIEFSSLIVCMMLGTVFCNTCDFSNELMERADRWTGPLMVLFFVISGASLQLSVFTKWQVVVIGVVFIVFRSFGKILGARFSSGLMHCEPTVQKYLGITLLPQAGVALGMSIAAMNLNCGTIIRNIVLFAVLIYELIGPLLTKIALDKAGEIKQKQLTEREKAKQLHI